MKEIIDFIEENITGKTLFTNDILSTLRKANTLVYDDSMRSKVLKEIQKL